MKVTTANVNGVRAFLRRGGLTELKALDSDVLLLQEVRATHEQLHECLAEAELTGYHVAHSPAASLGRSGVAVLTKAQPAAIREGLPGFADDGRWIEVDLQTDHGPLTAISVYVHSGEAGTAKQDDKYAFLSAMTKRLEALRRKGSKGQAHVVFGGDLNVARDERDIKNWKGNIGKAGFLDEERAYLSTWFDSPPRAKSSRFVDLGRTSAGDVAGPYTWWSWRGKAFDVDSGWRIDYLATTPELAGRCTGVLIHRADSYAERTSDHAAVSAIFTP
jgi:exodeoxyribonuclease-3